MHSTDNQTMSRGQQTSLASYPPSELARIEAAEAFLATLYREPRRYLNAAGLKHDAERWAGFYVSESDLVAAALRLGWSCYRAKGEPYRIRRNGLI